MTFSSIFSLEKRRAERNRDDISLIHFQLNGEAPPEEINKAETILRDILTENLRSSDLITRWQPRHYLMLVIEQNEQEIEALLARIEQLYYEEFPPAEVNLSYSYQKLN